MSPLLAAAAHHAMGGATPETFFQGLLSGLAHPVIGPDHLAFLLLAGVLVQRLATPLRAPSAALFVLSVVGGTSLHLAAVDLPVVEPLILGSVGVVATLALRRRPVGPFALGGLFAAAGLLHGYAYAESIIGVETMPLVAYLAGLVVVQSALIVGVAYAMDVLSAARRETRRADSGSTPTPICP